MNASSVPLVIFSRLCCLSSGGNLESNPINSLVKTTRREFCNKREMKMVNIPIYKNKLLQLILPTILVFLILLKINNNISINFSIDIIINTKINAWKKKLRKRNIIIIQMLKISLQKVSASCSVTTSAWGLIPFFGRLMNKIRVSSFQTQYRENKKFEASWLCLSLFLWIRAQESHKNTFSLGHWPNWERAEGWGVALQN